MGGRKGQVAWNKKEPLRKVCKCGTVFSVPPSLDRVKSCSGSCGGKGKIPWNKGLKAETDARVAEYGKKGSLARKGVPLKHSGQFKKGFSPWNKGKKYDEIMKNKLNISGLEIGRLEKYHACKSNSYGAIHYWVRKNKGKAKKCNICGSLGGKKGCTWANIDHKYRRNLEDYFEACDKCHFEYDVKMGLRSKQINPLMK